MKTRVIYHIRLWYRAVSIEFLNDFINCCFPGVTHDTGQILQYNYDSLGLGLMERFLRVQPNGESQQNILNS